MEQNTSINRTTGVNDFCEWISEQEVYIPIFIRIISAVEIPVMILTLVALWALIKSQLSAPIFVINLIASDLIQIVCMLMITIKWPCEVYAINVLLFVQCLYSLIAGLYFMACVAFERYLLVSHPIWYKNHFSLKVSCIISAIVWFIPLIFGGLAFWLLSRLIILITCFIPYPIIILCFVGTRRGLSHTISLTSQKRKLILGRLFLVLLTYTFLILPFVILCFISEIFRESKLSSLFFKILYFFGQLMFLNPVADCLLYLFLRPDVGDLMKSVRCCCRTDTHQNSRHSRDEHSRDSRDTFACCVSVQKPASHSQTSLNR